MRTIDQILDYAEEKLQELAKKSDFDWNAMNDDQRLEFIRYVVGDVLDLKGERGPRGRMGPMGKRGQKGNPGSCS